MRIVCIADTHGHQIDLPKGDILIHAGDACSYGTPDELLAAADWLGGTQDSRVLYVAGNHDWPFVRYPFEARQILEERGITYLQDQEIVIEGIKFYGMPWTPTFMHWAFMRDPDQQMREMVAQIPSNVDVLITHGPPQGILDPGYIDPHAGCRDLKIALESRLQPRVHVFGHLHSGYGQKMSHGPDDLQTHFINASIVDETYRPVNQPIVVEIQ